MSKGRKTTGSKQTGKGREPAPQRLSRAHHRDSGAVETVAARLGISEMGKEIAKEVPLLFVLAFDLKEGARAETCREN